MVTGATTVVASRGLTISRPGNTRGIWLGLADAVTGWDAAGIEEGRGGVLSVSGLSG